MKATGAEGDDKSIGVHVAASQLIRAALVFARDDLDVVSNLIAGEKPSRIGFDVAGNEVAFKDFKFL